MISPFRAHIPLASLSDMLIDEDRHSHVDAPQMLRHADHLRTCEECRSRLDELRAMTFALKRTAPPTPSPALWQRILTSRRTATRVVLPLQASQSRAAWRWAVPVAAAFIGATAATLLIAGRPTESEAGETTGAIAFRPSAPAPGDSVELTYRPAVLLSGRPWLRLRARWRSLANQKDLVIPVSTVARLMRAPDGIYRGAFRMPDSARYGAFVVEDSAADVIDDHGGRLWELLASDAHAKPLFEALEQRTHDLMGRNWEEAFATVRQMVRLYPDDLRTWTWLAFFQSMAGQGGSDSVSAMHNARLARFETALSHQDVIAPDIEGQLAWYAYSLDARSASRWRARLLHDAPTNSFAVQWRLIAAMDSVRVTNDTLTLLNNLETLWHDAPRDRMQQVARYGTSVAFSTGDTALIRRWAARDLQSEHDGRVSPGVIARQFASTPALRSEGIRRLNDELDAIAQAPDSERALDETKAREQLRLAASRRMTLAALGAALVADGQMARGQRLLHEAASRGWEPDVFRSIWSSSLASGDTNEAVVMGSRLVVDPRTPGVLIDTITAVGERHLGVAGWQNQLASARALYVERMLAEASVRQLPGNPRVLDIHGTPQALKQLTKGRVTVVAFWSRTCAPALRDIPKLQAMALRFRPAGISVLSIAEEAQPSTALTEFIQANHLTMPVVLDSWHEASTAFNQWGTPYYYVIDARGRVRFDVAISADVAFARANALRLADAN